MIIPSFPLRIGRYIKQSSALVYLHILRYFPVHVIFKHKELFTSTRLHTFLCPLPSHIPGIFFLRWSPDRLCSFFKSPLKSHLLCEGFLEWEELCNEIIKADGNYIMQGLEGYIRWFEFYFKNTGSDA